MTSIVLPKKEQQTNFYWELIISRAWSWMFSCYLCYLTITITLRDRYCYQHFTSEEFLSQARQPQLKDTWIASDRVRIQSFGWSSRNHHALPMTQSCFSLESRVQEKNQFKATVEALLAWQWPCRNIKGAYGRSYYRSTVPTLSFTHQKKNPKFSW